MRIEIKTTSAAVAAGYKKFHDEMSVRATPAKHNKRTVESSNRKNGAQKPLTADGFFSKCRAKASELSGLFSRSISRPENETIINSSESIKNLPVISADKWWSSTVLGEYVATEKGTPGYKKFEAMIQLTVESYRLKLDAPTIANINKCHTAYDDLFLEAYDSAYENLRLEGKSMQDALRLTYGKAHAQVLSELRSQGGYSKYIALISQRELVIKESVSKSDGNPTFPTFSLTGLSPSPSPEPQAEITSSKSDVSIESAAVVDVETFRENIGKAWEIAKSRFVPPPIEKESRVAKVLRESFEKKYEKTAVEPTPAASLTADNLKGIYRSAFDSAYTADVSTSNGSGAAVLSAHKSALDKVSENLPSFEHRMLVGRFKKEIGSLEPALTESKKSPSVQVENQDSGLENIVKPALPADVSRAESAMQTSGDTAIEESIEKKNSFSLMKWIGKKASNFLSNKSSELETKKVIGDLKTKKVIGDPRNLIPLNFDPSVKVISKGDSLLEGVLDLLEFEKEWTKRLESKAQSSSSNSSDGEMNRMPSRSDSVFSRAESSSSLGSRSSLSSISSYLHPSETVADDFEDPKYDTVGANSSFDMLLKDSGNESDAASMSSASSNTDKFEDIEYGTVGDNSPFDMSLEDSGIKRDAKPISSASSNTNKDPYTLINKTDQGVIVHMTAEEIMSREADKNLRLAAVVNQATSDAESKPVGKDGQDLDTLTRRGNVANLAAMFESPPPVPLKSAELIAELTAERTVKRAVKRPTESIVSVNRRRFEDPSIRSA